MCPDPFLGTIHHVQSCTDDCAGVGYANGMQVPERIIERVPGESGEHGPSVERPQLVSAFCSATDVLHHFDCTLTNCACACHAAENGSHLGGLSITSQAVLSRSHDSTRDAGQSDSVVGVQSSHQKKASLSFADLPAVGTLRLDRTLESAVQASWNELMPVTDTASIQVEYRIESDGALQYLRIWASTKRGYWNLVCEQWITAAWSHVSGLQFSEGYYSEALGRFLEIVARHQRAFHNVSGTCRNGLLLISPPTEDESREARCLIADVIAVLGSSPVEQLVAAWTEAQTEVVAAD